MLFLCVSQVQCLLFPAVLGSGPAGLEPEDRPRSWVPWGHLGLHAIVAMCVQVCMCACAGVCVYVTCPCVHARALVCARVDCVCACALVCVCVHMCTCACMCACAFVDACVSRAGRE